jgi:parallel beta-helix repeat protein
MKRLGLLVLIGYTASASVAHAATYYVAKSGNNGNTCAQAQSISTAKLTIAEGLKCLSAGDTLLVRAGNYDEFIDNKIPSGSSGAYTRIANYNGETVWLRPTTGARVLLLGGNQSPHHIEIDGINLDASLLPGGVHLSDKDGGLPTFIRLQDLEIIGSQTTGYHQVLVTGTDHRLLNVTIHGSARSGCGLPCSAYGIYLAADRVLIDGCNIYDVNGAGIHIYGNTPESNIVRNCRIHDITKSGDTRIWGIEMNGNNNQIYNNVIYGVGLVGASGGSAGIHVYSGSGNKLWNNTVVNNPLIKGIAIDAGASNTEVRNNIAYGNPSAFTDAGTGTTASNNLFGIDPLFVNLSGNDFTLKADSRAVDGGANVSVVTTDLAGVARPQGRTHDIGAYEFSGQPAASGPPAPPTGVRIVSN